MITHLARCLNDEDDLDLWNAVLAHVLADLDPKDGMLIEVGRCSHWLRPHQTRWTADGGFAFPAGYGSGQGGFSGPSLPQFDDSLTFEWRGDGWECIARRKRRRLSLRIAIPSRTTRHAQAAIHTIWHTGREKQLRMFGFRKKSGAWTCTAEG